MADRPEHSDDEIANAPEDAPSEAFAAIDACRSGSDDLDRELPAELAGRIRRDAQLAARYQAVQQFDHTVADAFARVPIPAGLESRLLAAIAEQQARLETENFIAEQGRQVVEPVRAQLSAEQLRRAAPSAALASRRRWLQLCGGALASTAAGLGFVWWRRSGEQPALSVEQMLHQALDFNKSGEARLAEAIPETREPAPAEFPRSRRLVGLRDVIRWRRLDGRLLGREGVAYELSAQDHLATLYVLSLNGSRGAAPLPPLSDEPPLRNQPQNLVSTGGDTAAVWQEHDRIQLLVVHGDVDFYRSFLMTPNVVA